MSDTDIPQACLDSPQVGCTHVPRSLIAACASAVTFCAAWTAWPLAPEPVTAPALTAIPERPAPSPAGLDPLDMDAFRVPIWVAPPPPPAQHKPDPPPPPLRLRLLAIVHESGHNVAAIYDPDADRVRIVGEGQALSPGCTVEAIAPGAITLRDSGALRTLTLREDQP
ncbi:MAG: hypothetical protein IT437_07490 [Phycisphaerales bacterium]|nr:hypothetical protein [Phycisphaerales bacterium]